MICLKFGMLSWPASLFEIMLSSFGMINIHGREFHLGDFMKNSFNIGLCSDTYELISFKFGVMVDMTKMYSFHISLSNLDLHSGSQGYDKAETSAIILLLNCMK